jgi:hypothetical protein
MPHAIIRGMIGRHEVDLGDHRRRLTLYETDEGLAFLALRWALADADP